MAKNYVQEGKTIPVENAGQEIILSGAPVVIGQMIAIAITDIPGGDTGDGLTEGVFQLPKLAADEISAGKRCISRRAKYNWKPLMPSWQVLPGKMLRKQYRH
jgi:predicted RecA/RadA family phage recombinase